MKSPITELRGSYCTCVLIPGVVSSRMDGSEPHHVVHAPTCGEARGMVPKLAKAHRLQGRLNSVQAPASRSSNSTTVYSQSDCLLSCICSSNYRALVPLTVFMAK